ncbi:Heat-inducible transcription repressor HrcA [Dehalobacter sp. UNSWDHB]|uniref:heat-inducible transcriptional repressor HrcA n=1 Tax=Dehalobacter sp. UNSWDHB TaxID=1339256 RepID=UPI00038796D6|nr:heat-inducible transcriptional repressor HrcA [Dehalobacter sp. UNSWDHB]EQB20991.1 Heat-inducible transcription repressor HrcA [Dehalobacter sp. UNSWDHB]
MEMDERKHKILKAIVQDYIATAEPVGSRTVSKKFELGVSPATIRNEMADLEELGLIEQPHTSAGRIPSDSGYRYYVDYLMDPLSLNHDEKKNINQEITSRLSEVQEVIEYTGKLISQVTNLTSIVLGPKSRSGILKNLYFLPYEQGKAIMVTVKENGSVENNIVDIGPDTSPEELQILANIFNQKMSGTRVQDLKKGLINEIYSELSRKRRIIDGMMGILERMFDDKDGESEERVYLGGTLNMLDQPEFRDINKVRSLFSVFEENNKLKELLSHDQKGLSIMIGAENADQVFKNCSIISATYQINGKQFGSVGVLGPTRMDYGKAIAIVDYMTNSLTELLTERHQRTRT